MTPTQTNKEYVTDLIKSKYVKYTILFSALILGCVGARYLLHGHMIGNITISGLLSNLFSGFCPILIAFTLLLFNAKIPTWLFWIGTGLWILFYPNSPYMISDLKHVSTDSAELINDDTLLVFLLALLSLFYGLLSLKAMSALFEVRYSAKFSRWMINITIILSCLGFLIGRIISAGWHQGNFYSWDIFKTPIQLIQDTWHALWPISENLGSYSLMILIGLIQWFLLTILKQIGDIEARDPKFEQELKNQQNNNQ